MKYYVRLHLLNVGWKLLFLNFWKYKSTFLRDGRVRAKLVLKEPVYTKQSPTILFVWRLFNEKCIFLDISPLF